MGIVRICGPKDRPRGVNIKIINCCSISKNWSQGLSPFFCGPCKFPSRETARNVENAWQFSKVYEVHVDENKNPTSQYFKWRKRGFDDNKPQRYPMGKGVIPLYSYYEGEKLSYIEARKKIYLPIYSKSVVQTEAFKILRKEFKSLKENETIWLWDFDGYDHKALNMTYQEAINCENRKFGHAFILGFLLEKMK